MFDPLSYRPCDHVITLGKLAVAWLLCGRLALGSGLGTVLHRKFQADPPPKGGPTVTGDFAKSAHGLGDRRARGVGGMAPGYPAS